MNETTSTTTGTTPADLFGDTTPTPAATVPTPAAPVDIPNQQHHNARTPGTPKTHPDHHETPATVAQLAEALTAAAGITDQKHQREAAQALSTLPAVIAGRMDAADLESIKPATRARIFAAFSLRLHGYSYRRALRIANVEYWEIEHAARKSPTFAAIRQDVDRAIRGDAAADIEDTLTRAAKGENPERGRRAPDTRAAAIVLPAIDPRYKPKETTGAPVVNIQLNV